MVTCAARRAVADWSSLCCISSLRVAVVGYIRGEITDVQHLEPACGGSRLY